MDEKDEAPQEPEPSVEFQDELFPRVEDEVLRLARQIADPDPIGDEKQSIWEVKHTAVIMQKRGVLHHSKLVGDLVRNPNGGVHVAHVHARFWNPKRIPRGWVTVWPDDDPEPFSNRAPRGLGKIDIARLVGNMKFHILHGPLKAGAGLQFNLRYVIIGAGILLAAGLGLAAFLGRS